MKTTQLLKKMLFCALFLSIACFVSAQAGNVVAAKISNFYTGFVRPVLIAWVCIMATIGGIMASNKVRRNEEEASEAIIGWFRMILLPVIVLAFAEVANSLYS